MGGGFCSRDPTILSPLLHNNSAYFQYNQMKQAGHLIHIQKVEFERNQYSLASYSFNCLEVKVV